MKLQRTQSKEPVKQGGPAGAKAKQSSPPAAPRGWTPARPRQSKPAVSAPPPLPAAPAPLTLAELPTSTLWASMPPLTQRQAQALLGASGSRGMIARAQVADLLQRPSFEAASPAEQAAAIREVLSKPPVLPSMATGELAPRPPGPYTLGDPVSVPGVAFPGKTTDAVRVEVNVAGRTVAVLAPADGQFEPDTQLSVEDLARGLAALPPEALARVSEVRLAPTKNPEDAFWAQQYGQASFTTFMTCGADGVVNVFPQPSRASARSVASTLIHEAGHAWSMNDWGAKDSAPWQAWSSAAARDGMPPSQYGAHNLDEDLAETQTLFFESRGTPQYELYKTLYPHRFTILEQRFGGAP